MSPYQIETAAMRLLDSRALAAVLSALMAARGAYLSAGEVGVIEPSSRITWSDPSPLGAVRISLLRKALRRIGVGNPIETAKGKGYRIPTESHHVILTRLVAKA